MNHVKVNAESICTFIRRNVGGHDRPDLVRKILDHIEDNNPGAMSYKDRAYLAAVAGVQYVWQRDLTHAPDGVYETDHDEWRIVLDGILLPHTWNNRGAALAGQRTERNRKE